MPPIDRHIAASRETTGEEFRAVHEWLDKDPATKAERHDITRMFKYGTMIEEKYGPAARDEYIRHIHDDVKAKFDHLREDLEKALRETLAYFGVK